MTLCLDYCRVSNEKHVFFVTGRHGRRVPTHFPCSFNAADHEND
jgi:hypothetical protein